MQPGVQSPSGTGPGDHDARLPPGLPAAPRWDAPDRPRGPVAARDLHDVAGPAQTGDRVPYLRPPAVLGTVRRPTLVIAEGYALRVGSSAADRAHPPPGR